MTIIKLQIPQRENTIFDLQGPQITEPKYGPEPTLREVLIKYYISAGIEFERAEKLTSQYIKEWNLMYKDRLHLEIKE